MNDCIDFTGHDEHNPDQFLGLYCISVTPLVQAVLLLLQRNKINPRAVAVWVHGLEEWLKKASDGRGGRGVAFPRSRAIYSKLLSASPALADNPRIPRLDKLQTALRALEDAGLVKMIKAPPQKGVDRSASFVRPTETFIEVVVNGGERSAHDIPQEDLPHRQLQEKAYVPVVITEEVEGSKIIYKRAPTPAEMEKYPNIINAGYTAVRNLQTVMEGCQVYLVQPEQPTLVTPSIYKSISAIVGPGALIGEGKTAQVLLPYFKKRYRDLGPEVAGVDATQIDQYQLRYQRVFSRNWDRGGRYFAPYISAINTQHRCCMQVLFAGELYGLVDYDLANLHIRLLYAKAFPGATNLEDILPAGGADLYDIGLPASYRSLVKLAMLTATNLKGKPGQLPATLDRSLVKNWPGRQRKMLNRKLFYGSYEMKDGVIPEEITPDLFTLDRNTAAEVRGAIEKGHPGIRHLWGEVHGPRLQYAESEILTYVMNHMSKVQLPGAEHPGVPLLPAHDGAATIDHPIAKQELESAFRLGFQNVTGIELDAYGLKGEVLQLPRQLEAVRNQLIQHAPPKSLHSAS
jgi:hypothetical protein